MTARTKSSGVIGTLVQATVLWPTLTEGVSITRGITYTLNDGCVLCKRRIFAWSELDKFLGSLDFKINEAPFPVGFPSIEVDPQ